jgi:hypothetical protein
MPARTSADPREAAKRFEIIDVKAFLLLVLNSLTWFRRCGDQRRLLVTARISTLSPPESNPLGLGQMRPYEKEKVLRRTASSPQ